METRYTTISNRLRRRRALPSTRPLTLCPSPRHIRRRRALPLDTSADAMPFPSGTFADARVPFPSAPSASMPCPTLDAVPFPSTHPPTPCPSPRHIRRRRALPLGTSADAVPFPSTPCPSPRHALRRRALPLDTPSDAVPFPSTHPPTPFLRARR
ncbi:uncharacterized protein LOC134767139 [Penaeus indicus]|uniref:uncharacterized protein LOC134767139 n=1 Tax=Penaeus indicus TaxID=29960 RepID=UPI00300C6C5C